MLISNIPTVEKEYVDRLLKDVQKRSPDILGFSLLLNSGIPIQSTTSIDKISDAALSSAMGAAVYSISIKAMVELFEDIELNNVIMQGKKGLLLLRGIEKHSAVLLVMANKVKELGFIYFLVENITKDISAYLDNQTSK